MAILSSESRVYIARSGIIFATYLGLGYFCREYLPVLNFVSVVWPATALITGMLLVWGVELLPALFVASFVLPLSVGVPAPVALGVALANSAEAGFVAWSLKRFSTFSPMINKLSDIVVLMLAGVTATLLSSILFAVTLTLWSGSEGLESAWAVWWIGHAVSMFAITPFAARWLVRPFFTKTWQELFEGLLGFGALATLVAVAFLTSQGRIGYIPVAYLLLLPLVWAALRAGPRGTTLALLITSVMAVAGTVINPSGAAVTDQTYINLQLFIGALSIIFLPFAALVEERKEASRILGEQVLRLEEALERIRAEDRAKSEFLAVLAHELRNPLSPILSGLELLKSEDSGQNQNDVLQMMGAHTHTIARLLDDLLDLSRITQKKFKLQKEAVTLRSVLDQTVEMVQPYITTRNHTFTLDIPPENIWLHADPVRLTQIFANLLNNAAKYTDPGGTIMLSARRQEGEVVVVVRDNGIGIAPDLLPKVFEPFAPGMPARKPGGLRIGLSLAKRMTELHHGTIEVQSRGQGFGAEFVVRLPLQESVQGELPLIEQVGRRVRSRFTRHALSQSIGSGRRILLVDDNEAAAQSLGALLEKNHHRVVLAYDAPEALEVAQKQDFDVGILDIGLPTMDGHELARKIKEIKPHMVLVALTGYGQEEDKQKAREAGFARHLVKPVSIVDVERTLIELRKNN